MGFTIRKSLILVVMFVMTGLGGNVFAQNVTVSPSTGKLIAAKTYDGEVGFKNGWSSMWYHNQLPLKLTVADEGALTSVGELANVAGNISEYNDGYTDGYALMGGVNPNSYMCISLPKGYRFTGYRIVLKNNLNGKVVNQMTPEGMNKEFYETASDFRVEEKYWGKTYTYYKACAKKSSGETQMGGSNSDDEYVITRTSKTESDMGSQLYFLMTHDREQYYAVFIKSIELYFTATGDYTADLTPTTKTSKAVSCLPLPFTTGKLDIGAVKQNTKDGQTYYSYDYNYVKDLKANALLYQHDAIQGDSAIDVAEDKHIETVEVNDNYYNALGNDTYFLESPTKATTQTNNEVLLGYRIVGAKLNYKYLEHKVVDKISYYISFNPYYYGTTTYYLGTDGTYSTTPTEWFKTSDGKIYSGNTYLSYEVTRTWNKRRKNYDIEVTLKTTTSASDAKVINIDDDGSLYVKVTDDPYYSHTYYLEIGSYGYAAFSENTYYRFAWSKAKTYTHDEGAPYTLNVYGTDAATPVKTVEVNAENPSGTIDLTGLNNDAVKFEVSNLDKGKKAFLTFDLELQALNPYINSLNLVCTNNDTEERMIQTFTTNDFAVRGGEFTFYAPKDWEKNTCNFTFESLYSNYGDNTYYEGKGSGNARYGFVKSDYYAEGKNLYDLDPNASYKNKVNVSLVGDKYFRFNNADDLVNTSTEDKANYLREFPFSIQAYEKSGGQFKQFTLNSGKNGTCYLFTFDESRYNIAPTRATQHRSYAFYEMKITLATKTFTPKATWKKIYDKSYYTDKSGNIATNSQYGLTLTTTETTETEPGYLTASQILDFLKTDKHIEDGKTFTNDQILYVDASNLGSVPFSKTELSEAKSLLAPNALFYLPTGNIYAEDNFAYKTVSGSFRACQNVVLTDKVPFYAPTSIDVDAANSVSYKRAWTTVVNGKVNAGTVIVPFAFSLTDGLHTNLDGSSFYLKKMPEEATLEMKNRSGVKAYDVTFENVPYSNSIANSPYVVVVDKKVDDANYSFYIQQKGSTIEKTPGSGTWLDGNESTITYDDASSSFLNKGTYCGTQLSKSDDVFYFSKGQFVNSKNLKSGLTVNVQPFRSIYEYDTSSKAKALSAFDISFGDEDDDVTVIDDVNTQPDMAVSTGQGTITVSVTTSQKVGIYALNGVNMTQELLQAGESRTYYVSPGVYVVNHTKIVVK